MDHGSPVLDGDKDDDAHLNIDVDLDASLDASPDLGLNDSADPEDVNQEKDQGLFDEDGFAKTTQQSHNNYAPDLVEVSEDEQDRRKEEAAKSSELVTSNRVATKTVLPASTKVKKNKSSNDDLIKSIPKFHFSIKFFYLVMCPIY